MTLKARLLDMGEVSALRSQSIYHGITATMKPGNDPAILLCRPKQTYVSIGYFQEAAKEVDLDYCEEQGIPVYRRQVGGGAVLLDQNQLFYHIVVPHSAFDALGMPRDMANRFAFLATPPITAYHQLGINAEFKPINDIHVTGCKIGGTGIGEFDHAVVFAGSMMMDFNHQLMAKVLNIPDEKMRDKIFQTLEAYITTIKRELGDALPVETVAEALTQAFESCWALELYPSLPTDEETAAIEEFDRLIASSEWLHKIKLRDQDHKAVKISANIQVLSAAHKAPGGMIRATIRVMDNKVESILLSGDFPVSPKTGLQELASKFIGAELDADELVRRFQKEIDTGRIELVGVGAEDMGSIFQQIAP